MGVLMPKEYQRGRVILRIPKLSYALQVQEAILESITELKLWLKWAHNDQTINEMKKNIEQSIDNFNKEKEFKYYIFNSSNKKFLGVISLTKIDSSISFFEIGYWLRTTVHGKGYIHESLIDVCYLALKYLNANRIEIRTDERNSRSRRVAEKAGFKLEGILRNNSKTPFGHLRNTAIYSIIKQEELL